MSATKKQTDLNLSKLLSLATKSKEEFLEEYNKFDESSIKELYFQVLTEIKKVVSIGNIDNLKRLSNLIDCINNVKNNISFDVYNNGDGIRNVNLDILACKHNNVKILEYLFDNETNILINLAFNSCETTILQNEENEECHNAFYYSIRSGNVELLDTLINKWPGGYFINNSEALDEALSKAYEELKLKNVPLGDEMEIFVENKLINLRFFSDNSSHIRNVRVSSSDVKERIELVLENITLLKTEYSKVEVDEKFLFVAKFIAQNIHILKRQLKSTYDRLPWEEIEFCLICFVSSYTNQQEINLYFYKSVLTKEKILSHLENFAIYLNNEGENIQIMGLNRITELPKLKREEVVENIIRNSPSFEELYIDYKQIVDVYSLEKINSYIELALSADAKEKEDQLIIIRALQVIGEYLKNTLESPKLSDSTSKLLLSSLPRNTREIVADLRNSLSHAYSLSKRSEIEENSNVSFFTNVQNDIKKISVVICDILYNNKIKAIRTLLTKIIKSESLVEIKDIAEVFYSVKSDKMLSENQKVGECKQIRQLIDELNNKINDKTDFEKDLFKQINDIIDFEKNKLVNIKTDYNTVLTLLSGLNNQIDNNKFDHNDIRVLKFFATKTLEYILPKSKPQSFKEIVKLSIEICRSVRPRMNHDNLDEVDRLVCEIFRVVECEMDNVKWIEELRDQLNKSKYEKDAFTFGYKNNECIIVEKIHNNQLTNKISALKNVLSKTALSNQLIQEFPSYKNNKKLQAVIEMLVLDIMSILGSSKNYLTDNHLFLDNNSPLLTGKNLRNHLAHGNTLIDILLFSPSTAIISNAKTLITENVIKGDRKIGKLIRSDPLKLKDKYNDDLVTITIQKQMFIALSEGNLKHLKSYVRNGADIHARNINSWTALHFAASSPSLEIVKYVLNQNLSIDVKNNIGQTPLHIASANGRKNIVEFLIEERNVCVDVNDNNRRTPLHLAAQNGHKDIIEILLKNKASTTSKDNCGTPPWNNAIRNNHIDCSIMLLEKDANVDINEALGGFTPLHIAADSGHLEIVNYLLKNKANVNAKNDRGGIPLHTTALNGHLEVVKALISKGANVNANVVDGGTPLLYAAENGHEEIVAFLLEHGASVNALDKTYNFAPINHAARSGYKGILELLLKNEANVNTTTVLGMTPLLFAVKSGHQDLVHLLIKNKASVNAQENNGYTALHLSAMHGHKDIIRYLIKKGAKINAKDNSNCTPLHIAAKSGNGDVLEALILEGADINSIDDTGSTALHVSSLNGHTNILKILINKGANINVRDKNMKMPLHIAVGSGSLEVVNTLIEAGSNINSVDNEGFTVLHLAALYGNKKLVEYLIKKNLKVNTKSKNGSIPLHLAVESNHGEVTNVLIKNGSVIDAQNNSGHTSLCLAILNNYNEIVDVLISKGADVNADGGKPLSLAVFAGYKDIVVTLLKDRRTNINIDPIGDTSLIHLAAKHGHKSIIEALLAKGANIEAKSTTSNVTPLFLAVVENQKEVVEFLISKKAKINAKSTEGNTPLHLAASKGYTDILKILLNNRAKANVKDIRNTSPIELAVAYNHLEAVKILSQFKEININMKTSNNCSLLHIAAQEGNLEMLKYLIDKGADIAAKNDPGTKPIHIAAREGQKNVVEFFLNNGFSITDRGAADCTLLHYAAAGGQLEVAKYLIEQKVDINPLDANGSTPVHLAATYGYKAVVEILIDNGGIYNAVDKFSRKPLEVATNADMINSFVLTKKLFEIVKNNAHLEVDSLVRKGAFVNSKNTEGVTPLHYAAWKGFELTVNALLQSNANPNVIGKNGWTPLHYATKFSHLEIVKALLSCGAIYNAMSDAGKMPLDFAERQDVISLLKLVTESFTYVQNGNSKVINDLKKVKNVDTIKAVMNTCNRENKTLIIAAMHNDFPQIEKLKQILQDDLSAQINIADKLLEQEKYQEALNIFTKVIERRRVILGADNPATLDIQEKIALILYKERNYDEAIIQFKEIYQKRKELLGIDNKDTLSTRSTMALVLHRQGHDDEALAIYKEVYQKQKKILGSNHADVLTTQTHMAMVLDKQQKYDEALKMNYEVLEKRKKMLGTTHPINLCIENNIAMILFSQGKYDEALETYRKVYELRKIVIGPNHSDTLRTLHNMVAVLTQQQKYDEALKAYREVYETQKAVLGAYNFDTLTTHVNMANLLFSQGKFIAALKIYQASLDYRRAILGPNHPDVLDIIKKIEIIHYRFNLEGDSGSSVLQHIDDDINVAASIGDMKVVQDLLDNGIDVNTTDDNGRTPLHFAISNGHKNIVDILLKSGADATKVTKKGNTPLHTAASKDGIEIIKILLQHVKLTNNNKFNTFINAKTITGGTTSLHVAAKIGSFEIVKTLLEYGAIYNLTDYKNNKTPISNTKNQNITNLLKLTNELFEDAKNGNRKIINKLQNIKSDQFLAVTNARNNQGNTLLQVAMVNKHKDIARMLLEKLKSQR